MSILSKIWITGLVISAPLLLLKLAQVGLPATWSWWWVFSPLLAVAAFTGLAAAGAWAEHAQRRR